MPRTLVATVDDGSYLTLIHEDRLIKLSYEATFQLVQWHSG